MASSGSPEQAEERGQLEADIAELKVGPQKGREEGQGLLPRAGGRGLRRVTRRLMSSGV